MKTSLKKFLDYLNYPTSDQKTVIDALSFDGEYKINDFLKLNFYVEKNISVKYLLKLKELIRRHFLDELKIEAKIKFKLMPSLEEIIKIESVSSAKILKWISENEIECTLSKKDELNKILEEYNYAYDNLRISNYIINEVDDQKLEIDTQYKVRQIIAAQKHQDLPSISKNNTTGYGRFNQFILNKTQLSGIISMENIDYEDMTSVKKITTEGVPLLINANEGPKKYFFKFSIKNNDFSIICKLFLDLGDKKMIEDINALITNSKTIAVSGTLKYEDNRWEKGFSITVNAMSISDGSTIKEKVKKIIAADLNRVEWCIHTKMSPMNGVSSIEDYIDEAVSRKYSALAITDINSVQSFPEAYNHLKKINTNLQLIYGAAFEMIDDSLLNHKYFEDFLNLNEYIVFDLETTGLKSNFHEITEFGAFKIIQGKIVDKFSCLIQTDLPISNKITEITKITNEMLENDGLKKNEAFIKIKSFIGSSVLVAHNGKNFDMKFLSKFYEDNQELLQNKCYDTLILTHLSNEFLKTKRFRLQDLAKIFNVTYNSENGAHRAIYDVEVLHFVILEFKKLLNIQKNKLFKLNLNNIRGEFISAYAKNQQGLEDLYHLISIAHTENFYQSPKILKTNIEKYRKNLLISNHEVNNDIFNAASVDSNKILQSKIKFYDFINVLSPKCLSHLLWSEEIPNEKSMHKLIENIIINCNLLNIPCVATSNPYYLDKQDKLLRKIIVNTKGLLGTRHHLYNVFKDYKEIPDNHFFTTIELKNDFNFLNNEKLIEDIVINNGLNILKRIEKSIKPLPDGTYFATLFDNAEDLIKKMVNDSLKKQYLFENKIPKIVEERVNKELNSIISHNFANIYLISQKIVQESLNNNYLVGSRGSVGSSFVATLLSITEVNPLPPHYICKECKYSDFNINSKYRSGYDLPPIQCPHCKSKMYGDGHNIPFETFLGFEGNKVPDIDLNFASDYQEKAHDYVKKLFGEKNVIRAGTISTLAKRTAFAFCKKYEEEIEIKFTDHERNQIIEKMVGIKRTTGQHPGGIIIFPKDKSIYNFTPVNYPADDVYSSWKTSHFAYEALHDNLLKLDLLGHVDPQALSELQKLTGIDPKKINFFDRRIMSIFTSTKELNILDNQKKSRIKNGAIGIPEFGTSFVRKILDDTQPDSFANLVQISGLSHGTDVWSGNAANLVTKEGKRLDDVICCRDDIMIYLINKNMDAKKAFNITENVRKGKGLTNEEISLLKSHGIEDWYIESCKKIKYMFPKAHATAYVIMAWRIAWFKIYEPLAYYCVYFTSRCETFKPDLMVKPLKEIIEFRQNMPSNRNAKEESLALTLDSVIEMLSRGFQFEQISANKSDAKKFVINNETKKIIIPFTALEGLGDAYANEIIRVRKEQAYVDMDDFIARGGANKTQTANLMNLNIFQSIKNK